MFFVQVLVFALALHLAAVIGDSSLSDRNLLTLNLKIQSGDDLDEDNQAQFLLDGKKCCSCPTGTTITQPAATTPTINAIGPIATTTTATTTTSTTTTSPTTTTTSTTTTRTTTATTSTTRPTTTYVSPYNTEVVSFLAGGFAEGVGIISDVELYSPDGKCNYKLAPLPMILSDSATTYYNGQIIVCGGSTLYWNTVRGCWSYIVSSNSWIPFLPDLQYPHNRMPGITYGNKFYVLNDGDQNEAFDFSLKMWVPWKPIPIKTVNGACMAIWRDSFIVFGGSWNPYGVQIYNLTADNWFTMQPMPQPRSYLGCIALPNNPDKFLIVGSSISNKKTTHLYDAKSDSWSTAAPSNFDRLGPGLVNMNGRIFAYGQQSTNTQCVEEFNSSNNTWTLVKTPLLLPQRHMQPLVLPASIFAPYVAGGCTGI